MSTVYNGRVQVNTYIYNIILYTIEVCNFHYIVIVASAVSSYIHIERAERCYAKIENNKYIFRKELSLSSSIENIQIPSTSILIILNESIVIVVS